MTKMKKPYQHSLADELKMAVQETPDRPFLRFATGEWTYRQFDVECEKVAVGLQRLGVSQYENVSVFLPNCFEFVVVWFALAKLGAVAAPVNTSFKGQLLIDAVDLVESRFLIAHETIRDQWKPVVQKLKLVEKIVLLGGQSQGPVEIDYEALRLASPNDHLAAPNVVFSDLSLLLYTSGTTGRSKAAMISHRFVLVNAAAVVDSLCLKREDVLYCPYPLFHLDAAVMTVTPALLIRGIAAIGERFSVSRYWDEMRQFKATIFDFMGATLTMLWKQPPSEQDRNHFARLGWGVPMPDWSMEFEERFGCRLVELYGSTEVGAIIFTPLDQPRRLRSCGKPSANCDVKLVDEQGFEVPLGTAGEMLVRPTEPSVIMDGYYGMPAETITAFRNLWFHTGDVLRQDVDGFLYFVGRRKDMVRRRGENISSAEVELSIESHPDVLECAVFGVPSNMTEEDVMACVVLRLNSKLTHHDLVEHCQAAMPKFMVPRYIRLMSALPKTPTDKIEKFRLQQEGITSDTWDREESLTNISN